MVFKIDCPKANFQLTTSKSQFGKRYCPLPLSFCLYLKQFGFGKNFSTAHAIINLIDIIENANNQNKFA